MSERYVIIGDGIAGAAAAETIREEQGYAEIAVLTDESEPLYNRIMLKTYMKGKLPLQYTRVHDKSWYEERDIELELETRVVDVDTEDNTVRTESGDTYDYDKLLVATGGSPRKLPCDEGYDNVHYMWTMDDARKMREVAEESERAVVIGGGLLGIDFAVVFAEHGADVDYLIRGENWWRRGLDREGAEIIHEKLEEKGVNIVTNTEVEEFETEDGEVTAAVSKEGKHFECDTVAVAIGQTPNSDFINVEKNDRGMIKTDKYLQTSESNIYAAGNMVEYDSPVFERRLCNGSWDHSEEMGETAALNMVGADFSDEKSCSEQQSGEDWCGRDEFDYVNTYGVGHFDVQFLAIGDWDGEPVSRDYDAEGHYRRLFFRDDRLVGAVMIGYTRGQEEIRRMIREKEKVDDREKLLDKDYGK